MSAVSCSDQGMEMGGFGSRRESEVGEHLSFEATSDAPPQRRKKKKKTATIGKHGRHKLPYECYFSAFKFC